MVDARSADTTEVNKPNTTSPPADDFEERCDVRGYSGERDTHGSETLSGRAESFGEQLLPSVCDEDCADSDARDEKGCLT